MATTAKGINTENNILDLNNNTSSITSEEPIVSVTGNHWDWAVDNNSDGLFDYIEVKIEINITNVTQIGQYQFIISHGNVVSQLYDYMDGDYSEGIYNLTIYEYHTYIHMFEGNVSYWFNLVSVKLLVTDNNSWVNADFNRNYTMTNFRNMYNRNDFAPPILTLSEITYYGVDLNEDGRYDFLQIDVTVNVTKSVHVIFAYALEYKNTTGHWNKFESRYSYSLNRGFQFEAGVKNISLFYSGKTIYDSGFNGELRFAYYSCYLISNVDNYMFKDYPLPRELNGPYSADNFTDSPYPLIDIKSITHFNIEDGSQFYYPYDDIRIEVLIEKFVPNAQNLVDFVFGGIVDDYGIMYNQEEVNGTHELWSREERVLPGFGFPLGNSNHSIEVGESTKASYTNFFMITVNKLPFIWDHSGLTIQPGTNIIRNTNVNFTLAVEKGSVDIEKVTADIENRSTFTLTRIDSTSTTETYQLRMVINQEGLYKLNFTVTDINGRSITFYKEIRFTVEDEGALTPGFELAFILVTLCTVVGYFKKQRSKR